MLVFLAPLALSWASWNHFWNNWMFTRFSKLNDLGTNSKNLKVNANVSSCCMVSHVSSLLRATVTQWTFKICNLKWEGAMIFKRIIWNVWLNCSLFCQLTPCHISFVTYYCYKKSCGVSVFSLGFFKYFSILWTKFHLSRKLLCVNFSQAWQILSCWHKLFVHLFVLCP